MIDEELYVLATQELNSNDRREDLWVRAIALASDDHDEARYLYTNLRVEELVEERRSGALSDDDLKERLSSAASLADSAGENGLGFEESGSDQSDVSRMKRKAEELNSKLRDRHLGNESGSQGSTGNHTVDTVGDSTLEIEPIQDDTFLNEDDISLHDRTSAGDEFDPLERTEPEGFNLNDGSLDLTSPEDLPPVYTSDDYKPETTEESTYADSTIQDIDPAAIVNTRAATETIDRFDATIEPQLLLGRAFTVVKHSDGSRKAVKLGSSWPALLFTLPWLIYKKLWGTALVYLALSAVVLFGLISTGLSLFDAGVDATIQQKLIFTAFALLALVGLFYLPFARGNQWVVSRLRRKGYHHHTDVNAQTANDALDLARE